MSHTRDHLLSLIDSHLTTREGRASVVLSVASLAKLAKLSRTTLYRYYPDVVVRLQAMQAPEKQQRRNTVALKLHILRDRLQEEQRLSAALAKACADLMAEIVELREDMKDQRDAHDLRVASLEKRLRSEARIALISSKT